MNRDEKKLYQVNKLSYNLVMGFVVLNTAHAIFTLQHMDVTYGLGIFIMLTILISMLSFLAAVKLQNYSIFWSYMSIGIGLAQIMKYFLTPKEIEGDITLLLTVLIFASTVFIFAGAIISIIRTQKRLHYIKHHYDGKEVMHH